MITRVLIKDYIFLKSGKCRCITDRRIVSNTRHNKHNLFRLFPCVFYNGLTEEGYISINISVLELNPFFINVLKYVEYRYHYDIRIFVCIHAV